MNTEPVSRATTWLRVSYWAGAIADGVMVVAMLYPPMLRSLLGVSGAEITVETRCALAMGASLMAGWTVLLLWADKRPLERSGVLILTVFPVIVGLALATGYGAWVGFAPLSRAIPIWLFQLFLVTLFLASYVYARKTVGHEDTPGCFPLTEYERHIDSKFRFIAGFYDLFDLALVFSGDNNPRLALARRIPNEPLRILDVCVGTANAAVTVAKTNDRNQIVGIDLSPVMLAVAQAKVRGRGIANVSFLQMNAQKMEFDDGEFDIAMVSFGLHEMDYGLMTGVLGEMARVVKEDGSVFVVDYDRPKNFLIGSLFSLFLRIFEPKHMPEFLEYKWAEILQKVGLELCEVKRCRFSKLLRATKRKHN
jgi:ubiquinone/menaquinone biosynthesis C-methylase UbiE